MPYYAVAKGRSTGVYKSWGDCENQVKGYSGASFKKFDSAASAQNFVEQGGSSSNYSYGSGHSYGGSGGHSYGGSGYSYSGSRSHSSGGYSGDRFQRDNDGYVEVYTDGACLGNGRDGAQAGIGVYWGDGNSLNTSEPVSGRHTNNSGEIQAATRAMKQAADNGIKDLKINTDSKFLIKSATEWMPGWKADGWRLASGGPVKNEQDFKELDKAQSKLNVKWNYVEGHGGIDGNEKADQLAKAGASKYH